MIGGPIWSISEQAGHVLHRGVLKTQKSYMNYPIPMGYTKKYQKFQIPRWPGSASSRRANYKKEMLKNTEEKSGNRIFQFFFPKNNF